MQDNITDIIGQKGNSGSDNVYLVDCELLYYSCSLGDELSIKVLDRGDRYTTNTAKIIISSNGFDVVSDLQLIKKDKHFYVIFSDANLFYLYLKKVNGVDTHSVEVALRKKKD